MKLRRRINIMRLQAIPTNQLMNLLNLIGLFREKLKANNMNPKYIYIKLSLCEKFLVFFQEYSI
jgi:hypothetical protein